MINIIGHLMENIGMMNWGIMYLALSRNVKVSLFCFFILAGTLEHASFAAAPYSNSEMREVETSEESKIRELRSEEITQLRIALGRRSPVNRRADLYFRLAEIYLEAYRSEFLLEGRVHEKRLEHRMEDRFINRSHSKPYLSAGIQACQEILGFRIPYEKMDQVYYFLGFYYAELENRPQSQHYYESLVKTYPQSIFAGPAYKELGEYAYQKTDFSRAQHYFEAAIQKAPQENWAPIQHKLAWSYYRTRQYDRAISMMKESIANCTRYSNRFQPLKDEALRDMATLMTERGKVEEALQYFKEVAGDQSYFPKILEKLGAQYERNVEVEKAIAVYETLLKTHPDSDAAFRVRVKLVELDLKQKQYARALTRLKDYRAPTGGDSETQAAGQNLRVMIRKVATEHHQTFRKKGTRPALEIAESYYSSYMSVFLKDEDPHHEIPEIQMYLAEVKRELGKSREVAELYRKVVASKDKRYAKEAALLWTQSLVEAIKKSNQKAGTEPSDLEKDYIEASDLLQSSLGDSTEAKEAALRAAQVQAGYKSTRAQAIQRIESILSRWPSSIQALSAAQLWLQLYTDDPEFEKKIPEFTQLTRDLRKNSGLMAADQSLQKGKLKAFLDQQDTKLQVSTIAKYEKEKDFVAAAKGYEEFAAATQEKDFAEKAYGNAVSNYLKASDASDAILKVTGAWNQRFPKSPKLRESLRVIATSALIRGNFEFSARTFERLGTEFGQPDSLETSARIFEGIGDSAHAQQEWAKFLDLYRGSPRRWPILLSLARSQEQARLDGEASRSYKLCAEGPFEFQAECLARLADLYLKDKDPAQAKSLYQKVASLGGVAKKGAKKSGPTSPYIGYARYRLADLAESEASFEPLKFPEAQLQKALAQRLGFLEPLSRSYQSVVEAGGPWAIAALNRLALWATRFADEVDAIEPPASLKPASVEKLRRDLGSVSKPLREKAKSTWNESYQKAVSIELFSPALPEVADHLTDFGVSMPGRAQGVRGHLHLAGLAADPHSSSAALEQVRNRLIRNTKDASAWSDYGNLLWIQAKPLMAKLAYEQALSIQPKDKVALNNLAVVKLMSEGEEDWVTITEGVLLLKESLRVDDFFLAAKMNLATLMNYYRLFAKSKQLWDQVQVRLPAQDSAQVDVDDGLGIALQGIGNATAAEGSFEKGTQRGAPSSRFAKVYHAAGRSSVNGKDGASRCVSLAGDLDPSSLQGFEKTSLEYLKRKCELWKLKN